MVKFVCMEYFIFKLLVIFLVIVEIRKKNYYLSVNVECLLYKYFGIKF